jgi:hypothetical protein
MRHAAHTFGRRTRVRFPRGQRKKGCSRNSGRSIRESPAKALVDGWPTVPPDPSDLVVSIAGYEVGRQRWKTPGPVDPVTARNSAVRRRPRTKCDGCAGSRTLPLAVRVVGERGPARARSPVPNPCAETTPGITRAVSSCEAELAARATSRTTTSTRGFSLTLVTPVRSARDYRISLSGIRSS